MAYAAFEEGLNKAKMQRFCPTKGSTQYKEMFTVILTIQDIHMPLNLYMDSLRITNLMPHLSRAHVCLDANLISPIMVTLQELLESQVNPINIQQMRGYATLPGFLSRGNSQADRLASGICAMTLQEVIQLHELTHVNWKGLHYRYPQFPIKDLKKIVFTFKSCQSYLLVPPLQGLSLNPWSLTPNMFWQTYVIHFG